MSQTLVISDNEILNQLYITNLEVYLGTTVILVDSIQKGIETFKKMRIDLVVSMSMINGQDAASALYNYFIESKLPTPLVVIGKLKKDLSGVLVVPSSYHLQNLVRSCAQLLGITAKEMAEKEVPEYYRVGIHFLNRIKEVPCSIYLQMKEEKYALVAKKGDNITEVCRKFLSEGVTTLFVNSLDRLLIINTVSTSICDFLKHTEGMDLSEKSEALKEGFEFAAASFAQSPAAGQEIMDIANACTRVMEEVIKEVPTLKKLLSILNSNRDGHIYTHSILASFVGSYIIRKVSWGGESHIEKINFVLFFHDILLAPIYLKHPELRYEEDLLFDAGLDDKEKEVILNHSRLAAEVIVNYKRAPIGADLLIKQHHGMTNGMGFALDYKDDISPISKIIIVSEAFIEEYMKARDTDSDYVVNPKKIIETLYEKFKRSTYRKILDTLENFPM